MEGQVRSANIYLMRILGENRVSGEHSKQTEKEITELKQNSILIEEAQHFVISKRFIYNITMSKD